MVGSGMGGGGSIVNPVQIQKYLRGVDYPVTKSQLIEIARQQGADDNVINTLQMLPEQEFDSPISITKAIGDLT